MGANGNILGPTIILRHGQKVNMHVKNDIGEPTTIHWHGMHVAPQNDGGPHVVIQKDSTWRPSFPVLDPASTHWYHPHLHEKTNEHVQKGIAGFIIVRDSIEGKLKLPRTYGVDDIPLVLQTKYLDTDNQIVTHSALDSIFLINGTRSARVDVPAQMVRLRLLNGASERYFNIGLSGNRSFQQIGSDGGLLSAPVSLTRLMLAPGERAEIVVNLSGLEGQSISLQNFGSELANGIYGARQPGMGAGQTIPNYTSNPLNGGNYTMLTLRIGTSTANAVTALPAALISHNPWKAADAQTTRSLTFMSMNMGPTAIQGPFVINNAHFDMSVINFKVPFENIEIWELRNQTPIGHPFHIHNVPFYILDINGVQPPENLRGKKDVVHVPAGNGTVRFITRFEDFYNDTLPYMYHCHILTHEDDGMMGQFIVQSPCPTVIQQEPADALREIGETAVFSVQTSGSGHTFQWQTDAGLGWQSLSNAGQYSGVTSASLSVANISAVNHNQLFRCVISNNDCNYTSQAVRITVPSLGLQHHGNPGLALYPNPAQDLLRVRLDISGHTVYRLCDLNGRIIQEGILKRQDEQLSLKGIQPGVYIFSLPELGLQQKIWKDR
jgi:bilirubin oxidase